MDDITKILEYIPEDYDPNADLAINIPPPPPEGRALVRLYMREREGYDAIYVKTDEGGTNPRLVATHIARYVNDDESNGGYLKDFYATSNVNRGQVTSTMAYIAKVGGAPFAPHSSLASMKAHYEELFRRVGEAGVVVPAQLQWVKSLPALDETGTQQVDQTTGKLVWTEIKGIHRIKAQLMATLDGSELEAALERPWVYEDPLTGETRQVRCEIARLTS